MQKSKSIIKIVVTVTVMTLMIGCGKKGGYNPDYVIDKALVLPANHAWVDSYNAGERDGFIFSADGTFNAVTELEANSWVFYGVDGRGSIETSGGVITVEEGWLYYGLEHGAFASYAISKNGDTLTLTIGDVAEKFLKTSGVKPSKSLAKPTPRNAKRKSF